MRSLHRIFIATFYSVRIWMPSFTFPKLPSPMVLMNLYPSGGAVSIYSEGLTNRFEDLASSFVDGYSLESEVGYEVVGSVIFC